MDYFFTGCMVFVCCCWILDIRDKYKKRKLEKKKEPLLQQTEYGVLVKGN